MNFLHTRRVRLSGGLAVAAVLLTGACGSGDTTPILTDTPGPTGSAPSASVSPSTSADPTPTKAGEQSCDDLAASLSRKERLGQLFMVSVSSGGATASQLQQLDRAHVGSVILLGNSTAGRATIKDVTDRIRKGVDAPKGTETLLAGDQEGGQVQRFQGNGFSRIPAARDQAELSDSTLTSRAEGWGKQLKEAGIDADLAPVADLVPAANRSTNQPIGQLRRDYGSDPDVVAAKVAAFTAGMEKAGVATSVKHFPGLGRVRGNTDIGANVRDTVTTGSDADLVGFAAGTKAGADLVMISSATYTKIDAEQPAAFSTTVMRMARRDLGFDGVIISDDMNGAALQVVPPGERILRWFKAGGDLALVSGDDLSAMIDVVDSTAAEDRKFDTQLTRSVTRVLALKARHGLADCAP